MKKINMICLLIVILFLSLQSGIVFSQEPSKTFEDITIIVPSKVKNKTTYFTFSGGVQLPFWVNVPMTPTDSPVLKKKNEMEVSAAGWYAGAGIMKKTKSRFEAGMIFNYSRNKVPVAYEGQSSTSDWVFEQTNQLSRYTEIYETDIIRLSEVIIINASVRYKIPVNNLRYFIGISGGTYSSIISYGSSSQKDSYGSYNESSLGMSAQIGAGFIMKNQAGKEKLGINLFGDFAAPSVNEKYMSLFKTGWRYENAGGSKSISPFRVGISVDFH